ncbi:MAG: DMT family transporter [Pseudomonadota bacterium]|nr:DMT family transporter [Pseudomonadota bacterium]
MTPARKKLLGILLAFLSAVVFGVSPSTARAVYADGGNAILVIVVTTAARALGLCMLCLGLQKPLFRSRTDTRTAMSGGFFQAISLSSVFVALIFLPGPLVIIIMFTHTLMLLFFMAWRGEVRLDALALLTTFAALGGLSLVLDVWHVDQRLNLTGVALSFLAAIAMGSRLYIYGRLTKSRDPAVVGAEAFIFAALFVLLLMFFKAPAYPASTEGWLWLAAGSLSLVLGTIGMFYSIALLGAFNYSLLLKMEPMFTALFAVLLIGEYLSPLQYTGMAIVIASLMAYQYGEHRRKGSLQP